MPEYIFLLRDDGHDGLDPDDAEALMERFVSWTQGLKDGGHLRGVRRLAEGGGQTLRGRGGAVIVDGPFAEAREAVAGYFVVEAADPAAALELAKACPGLGHGCSLEIREVVDYPLSG